MLNKIQTTKNYIVDHKTPILVTALVVTSTLLLLQNRGIKSLNQFLKDNGLFETYYHPEEL